MKIAYLSPLPPQSTGIADYSNELLSYLEEYALVTLFFDPDVAVHLELASRFPIRTISEFPACRWDPDFAVYQMGNNLFHETIYQTLQ